jgi:hypothetical protein
MYRHGSALAKLSAVTQQRCWVHSIGGGSPHSEHESFFIEMAERWLTLAERAEKTQDSWLERGPIRALRATRRPHALSDPGKLRLVHAMLLASCAPLSGSHHRKGTESLGVPGALPILERREPVSSRCRRTGNVESVGFVPDQHWAAKRKNRGGFSEGELRDAAGSE